jgi:hypothetical protein
VPRLYLSVALLLACIVLFSAAQAQSTFGSIRGTVQDASGAVIPGSLVTVHSLDENLDRQVTTNDSGEFVVENLKAGRYRLTVHHDGLSDAVVNSATLEARQDLRIPITLKIAAAATVVEVSDLAEQVNTENGTIGNVVTNLDLGQMPLNSRAVSSSPLAGLALSASVTQDSQGNIAVGGAPASEVGFSVDGISTANVRQNGALKDAYPSSEGISEVKVTAFNNNAEFAQVGDVTFTTKSGTSQWHGSGFEYFQNSALDATIYNFPEKAPKDFNTFGFSLGGPVILPKLGALKNRTFFYFDYEGNRKSTSAPEQLLVPTPAMLAGNLQALVNAAQLTQPAGTLAPSLTNPFTGLPYPNNTIPTCVGGGSGGCINTAATALPSALLHYYPLPNLAGYGPTYYPGGQPGVSGPAYNYQTLVPTPSSSNGWDLRVDQNITTKQSIYARYSWKNLLTSEGASGLLANQFLPNVLAHDQNRSLLISHNYTIRPNLLNEVRFGFTHFTENDAFPIQGSTAISQLGLQGINIRSHPTGDAFPTFTFSDGTISSIGQDRTGTTISNTTEITDNLTRIVGKHTFRFGVDARRVRYNALMFFQPSDDYGDFTFNPLTFTNYALGDFLLGLPTQSFFAITSPQINALSTQWGVYGQDEWQVNSHLTLNFGLRWELLPPFDETQGDLGSFDPRNNSVLVPDQLLKSETATNNPALQTVYTGFLESFNACSLPNRNTALACSNVLTASQDHVTQGLRALYKRDFDPRISLAYRPFNDNKTVIRSGFGIFTVTTLGPMSFNNAGNPTSNLLTNVNAVYNAAGALQAPLYQFPQTAPASQNVSLGGGSLEQANDPNFRDPQVAQWNLTVERQLTSNTVLRVSYVGMHTYRMPVTVDWNQIPASTTPYTVPAGMFVDPRAPYQNWLLLMSSENVGSASYQAGQVEVAHKLSHGLSFQANYTFAKDISDAQGSDAPTVFASEEAYAVEIANRFNLRSDRGNVVGTPRQRLLLSGVYQLPFGAGRLWNKSGYLNAVLGGWDLSTVTTIQTGQWLTPSMSPALDQSNTDMVTRSGGGAIARPDCVGNSTAGQSRQNFYNINAFVPTPAGAGRFGNCGVGILEGPNLIGVNSGLAKNFSIRERYRLRFEATFTNAINRLNFAPPQTNINNPQFGALTSVLPQGAGGNRTGQLALRLDF